MSKLHKKMVLKDLSYNDIMVLERELLYFTDQHLYQSSAHAARTEDLNAKLGAWDDLAATTLAHRDMHQQILSSIEEIKDVRKAARDFKDDERELVLRLPIPIFDVIVGGFNSDYLSLQKADQEISFWKRLSLPQVERRAYIRGHKAMVKALREAEVMLEAVEEDEVEAEEAPLMDSTEMKQPTMRAPAGSH